MPMPTVHSTIEIYFLYLCVRPVIEFANKYVVVEISSCKIDGYKSGKIQKASQLFDRL